MAVYCRGLIRVGVDARDAREVITLLSGLLERGGMVTPQYREDVLRREAEYPTGLPTGEVEVAIPHAGGTQVLLPGIAAAQLSRPVAFRSMGNPEQRVMARLVFLLAIKDPREQLDTLRTLMATFQDQGAVRRLAQAENVGEFAGVLRTMGWEEQV